MLSEINASQIAFPEELRAADAPEVLVHLCPGRKVSAILAEGWTLASDSGPLPYYFELVTTAAAARTGGAGVGLLARKAISQGIRIMQRSNATFYTVGRTQRIPNAHAVQWPLVPSRAGDSEPQRSPWRRSLAYLTESSRRPKTRRLQ